METYNLLHAIDIKQDNPELTVCSENRQFKLMLVSRNELFVDNGVLNNRISLDLLKSRYIVEDNNGD